MVRKFGAARVECMACQERVYPVEEVKVDGRIFHKTCLRCAHCNMKVGLKGLAVIGDKIYCKPHFKELFKLTGGSYDAFDDIQNTNSNNNNKTPVLKRSQSNEEVVSPSKTSEPPNTAEPTTTTSTVEPAAPIEKPKKSSKSSSSKSSSSSSKSEKNGESSSSKPSRGNKSNAYANTLSKMKRTGSGTNLAGLNKAAAGSPLYKALKMRNLTSLKSAIEIEGVKCLFEKGGADNLTPIEFAFRSNFPEGGRYMIDYIGDMMKEKGVM